MRSRRVLLFTACVLLAVCCNGVPQSAMRSTRRERARGRASDITTSPSNSTGRAAEPAAGSRAGQSRGLFKELVKGALVLAGNRVLGEQVTSALRPLARPIVDRLLPEDGLGGLGGPSAPLPDSFGQSGQSGQAEPSGQVGQSQQLDQTTTISRPAQQVKPEEDLNTCTTPQLGAGVCRDLGTCPQLLFDLTNLRSSICFQSLFVPGVCCPE
ncbi:uncharacterized protein LOC119089834 [Pollicipes pollicipes]|uniref:uncharacterized protein LOC119089834 n=1 Tax=Pollicipes pollicipes TaxID=41117 RepID=UPI00188544DF|nr:uncharacterized protein LOC119089834 [Pollicipes pollicipes]